MNAKAVCLIVLCLAAAGAVCADFDNPAYRYSKVLDCPENTFAADPQWSPDGTRVVWAESEWSPTLLLHVQHAVLYGSWDAATGTLSDIQIVEQSTDPAGAPVSLAFPRWSPDGTCIAYIRREPGTPAQVWRYSVGGGTNEQWYVPAPGLDVQTFDFYGGGATIVFQDALTSQTDLFVTDALLRWSLTDSADVSERSPRVWRSDARQVLFWSGDNSLPVGVHVLNTPALPGSATDVVTAASGHSPFGAVWGPNNSYVGWLDRLGDQSTDIFLSRFSAGTAGWDSVADLTGPGYGGGDWNELGAFTGGGSFLFTSTGDGSSGDIWFAQAVDSLSLQADDDALYTRPGEQLDIVLRQSGLAGPRTGYQAFLSFDPLRLQIGESAITFTSDPYDVDVRKVVSGSDIDLARGRFGTTTADAELATLTFTAVYEGISQVVFRESDPPSLLTDAEGETIPTHTVDSPVIVIDGTPPVIQCPEDVSANSEPGQCVASVELSPPAASDTPSGLMGVTGTRSDGLAVSDPYPAGNTTITWVAEDRAGNTAQCVQTVTVNDSGNPTISCPPDLVVDTDAGACYATNIDFGTPVVSDDCGVAGITNDAPPQLPLGDTLVTWTVTDHCGKMASCIQKVTVRDAEPPTITCPADVVTYPDPGKCFASEMALGEPAVSDNCSVASVTNDAPAEFPVGETTVTWTVTDGAGNTDTCAQKVTVEGKRTVAATVQLAGVTSGSFTRCIAFTVGGSGGTVGPVSVSIPVAFTDGLGSASFEVPACASWTCISAKDPKHTLSSRADLVVSGHHYTAQFVGTAELMGGDLTNDDLVDIRDFGVLAGQYGQSVGMDTTCGYLPKHADIDGDGLVLGSSDFSFIYANFLKRGSGECKQGAPSTQVAYQHALAWVPVWYLAQLGYVNLDRADANRNGILEPTDMMLFMQMRRSR